MYQTRYYLNRLICMFICRFICILTLHKRMKFPIKDFFGKCDSVIYWRNPSWKTSFFVQYNHNLFPLFLKTRTFSMFTTLSNPIKIFLRSVNKIQANSFRSLEFYQVACFRVYNCMGCDKFLYESKLSEE